MIAEPSPTFRVAGGWHTTRDAEHAFAQLTPPRGDLAFVAITFEPGQQVVVSGAATIEELAERARMFVFPGHEELVGTLTVAELLGTTAIDEVRGLAGVPVSGGDVVETQGHVRPLVESGRLVLVVRPYGDGTGRPGRATLVPFEQRNPTPCCADH